VAYLPEGRYSAAGAKGVVWGVENAPLTAPKGRLVQPWLTATIRPGKRCTPLLSAQYDSMRCTPLLSARYDPHKRAGGTLVAQVWYLGLPVFSQRGELCSSASRRTLEKNGTARSAVLGAHLGGGSGAGGAFPCPIAPGTAASLTTAQRMPSWAPGGAYRLRLQASLRSSSHGASPSAAAAQAPEGQGAERTDGAGRVSLHRGSGVRDGERLGPPPHSRSAHGTRARWPPAFMAAGAAHVGPTAGLPLARTSLRLRSVAEARMLLQPSSYGSSRRVLFGDTLLFCVDVPFALQHHDA
jgi:hypothetical protein